MSRRQLVAALLAAGAALAVLPSPGAAAPSLCGPGKTSLGGPLYGHPDRASVNASVNVELTDAATHRAYDVYPDGRVDTVGRPAGRRYSVVDHVNPELTPQSAAAGHPAPNRNWGRPGSSGVLCFTSNPRITQAYIEVYPRRPVDDNGDGLTDRHVTDRSRYGGAAHYRQPVRAGEDNASITLRIPQNIPSAVGFLHGYITYRGRAVPPAAPDCGKTGRPACHGITTVRAFTADINGPGCGVEGFSASHDGLDPRARGGAATYYRINALAGGRCGHPAQGYNPRVTCVSFCGPNPAGGTTRTIGPGFTPGVRMGTGTQVDFNFG